MSWLDYFRTTRGNSARTAKERLQIVIAHERIDRYGPSYLPRLRQDIIEVIRKYVAVDEDQVKIQMEQEGDMDVLALNIHLPDTPHLPETHCSSKQ
ncbi:cell division topological specificity factor MinE [Nitrosococcus wardiae]|uniref:Cell division topological specificity factor n=1 Tax=Nitrosococcus wardiae TaxID=1814290 RepID=A0A4P7BZ67_9GAMM|nr:cell division topological specificity factor MinE [Nitrosococcus wardiae]QBQ53812.1 cell division topological specificity factor MinE [Nitrosococcus wardiae]